MKASVVTAFGGPEVMKYQDMPDPKSGAGDVLVKVAGIGRVSPAGRKAILSRWEVSGGAVEQDAVILEAGCEKPNS